MTIGTLFLDVRMMNVKSFLLIVGLALISFSAYGESDGELVGRLVEVDHKKILVASSVIERDLIGEYPESIEGKKAYDLYKKWRKTGRGEDIQEVHTLLKVAADKEDGNAIVLLGRLTQLGIGVFPDPVAGIKLYERALELGSLSAAYQLALTYYDRIGVKRDKKKALKYLNIAMDGGYDLAELKLGLLLYESKKYEKAKRIFINYADKGYPEAYDYLAEMFSSGRGYKSNQKYAETLLNGGVALGWGRSSYRLYVMHMSLYGPKQKEEEVVKYLVRAAEMNSADAISELCLKYIYGDEVIDKNQYKAMELCKRSANMGSSLGAANLAYIYSTNNDLKKRVYWIKVSAFRGNAKSMGIMSADYYKGSKGFERNLQKSFDWAALSADAGWPTSMLMYAAFLIDEEKNDIPSLSEPDWKGCWYWSSIKQELAPSEQTSFIKEKCEEHLDAGYVKSAKKKVKEVSQGYQINFWVNMYRREVALGKIRAN